MQIVPYLLATHYLFVIPHHFGVPHPTVMSYLLAILRACACACVCVCGAEKGQVMAQRYPCATLFTASRGPCLMLLLAAPAGWCGLQVVRLYPKVIQKGEIDCAPQGCIFHGLISLASKKPYGLMERFFFRTRLMSDTHCLRCKNAMRSPEEIVREKERETAGRLLGS